MLDEETRATIETLRPLFQQFVRGAYGLAVGGAHAKGKADAESDLDLFMFAPSIVPDDERSMLAAQFSPDIREILSVSSLVPYVNAETDFSFGQTKIECWIRDSAAVERSISECSQGIVTQDYVMWTTNGFYNHCVLSDLSVMIPVDDPAGMLAAWKERTRVYPPKLRQAIIDRHLRGARFWPHDFQYAGAIARHDVVYCAGIVQQVVHHLIQVLFAFNEVYFPGDKKLNEAILSLPASPAGFVERIQTLFYPAAGASTATLQSQQREVQRLLADVEMLVAEKQGEHSAP